MMGPLGGAAVGWGLGRSRRRATPWWYVAGQTCVAAYQAIGAPSLEASYVNLANPGTYDAAPGVAPTFDAATGWTFDGATQYLTTGFAGYYTGSVFVRFSDRGNTECALFGSTNTMAQRWYIAPALNDSVRRYGNGGNLDKNGLINSGNMGFAGNTAYLDGFSDGTISPGKVSTALIYLGAWHEGAVARFFFAGKIQAVAIYSTTLSASDVAALTARMAAL